MYLHSYIYIYILYIYIYTHIHTCIHVCVYKHINWGSLFPGDSHARRRLGRPQDRGSPHPRADDSTEEIGLLPSNQRQHRTLHIQKDVLLYALCRFTVRIVPFAVDDALEDLNTAVQLSPTTVD